MADLPSAASPRNCLAPGKAGARNMPFHRRGRCVISIGARAFIDEQEMLSMRPIAALALAAVLAAPFADAAETASLATTPADRLNEAGWKQRHEKTLEKVKAGGFDLVFIGDSITQGWEGSGKETWQKYYAGRKALNLGYSGDRTEHVLWRLMHGEMDGLKPKAAVMMIGTNNTGHRNDPPEEIAAGVEAILKLLREKSPETKVLLVAIFPRAAKSDAPMRVNNDKANALLKKLADDQRVFFLDINSKLLEADGTLSKDIMPDLLHPQAKGYTIWAEAIEPSLAKLLGETR
jgi:lysophospholipase L1-like esterase